MDINKLSEPIRKKYHPFQIPPDINLAQHHRECSQFGPILDIQDTSSQKSKTNEENSQEIQSCPCCDQPPRKLLHIFCKTSQIYDISEPVGYYFTFIKIMGFALFIIMLAYGTYTLVVIVNKCAQDDTGGEGECLTVYGIPIPKIHIFFKIPIIAMNCVAIILLYLVIAYLLFKYAYLHQKNLCNNERPSDFSILLSGLDHENMDKINFQNFFEDFEIKDIIYTYKIEKYMKKLSKKSILQAKRDLYCQMQQTKQYNKYQNLIHKIDDQLIHIKNKFVMGYDIDLRTDKIIVTFQTCMQKLRFEQLYKMKLSQNIYYTFCGGSTLIIDDQPIYIQPLGEPYELKWENFETHSKKRYLKILVSNLVFIFILSGSFALITFLSKGEKQNQTTSDDVIMSIIFAVLIEAVNTVFVFTITSLTSWEKRYTKTGEISIMLYKKCVAFFLNTTFLPFSLFYFKLFQPDEDDLIRNILTIFYISNLITPIVGFYIHPSFLYRVYQQYRMRKQISNKNCVTTQIKANSIFQKQTFMLDERLALASQLLTNCMFYAAIFPFGILITLVGMFITYWSSKIWLIKYCAIPKFSYRIGRNINYICCLFPCVYAFGFAANIYIVDYTVDYSRIYSIYIAVCTIPISLLFILYGESTAIKYIHKNRSSVTECFAKKSPLFSYKNLNPTSFLHSNIGQQKLERWFHNQRKASTLKNDSQQSPTLKLQKNHDENNLWNNLISYVMARQMGIQTNVEQLDNGSVYQNSNRSSLKSKQQEEFGGNLNKK